MAPRLITSDTKPSIRHREWLYSYYNAKTSRGTQCVAVIPKALAGYVRRGFAFDDERDLEWNEELRASVLKVDFDAPLQAEPSLPPGETGWGDPDGITSFDTATPEALRPVAKHLGVLPEPPKLDTALEELLEQACMAFTYACKRIGVAEKPRAMEAQKIATTCLIPWLKAKGVNLSEEDEKAMTF